MIDMAMQTRPRNVFTAADIASLDRRGLAQKSHLQSICRETAWPACVAYHPRGNSAYHPRGNSGEPPRLVMYFTDKRSINAIMSGICWMIGAYNDIFQ